MSETGNNLTSLLLSAEAAAKLLDISVRHFYGLISAGRVGPVAIRLGRSVRWSYKDIEAWLSAKDPKTGKLPTREQWLMQNSEKYLATSEKRG
jgi:excisionase family DNA binding protein